MTTVMRQEIDEQPDTLRATIDAGRARATEIAELRRDHVLFFGRGSSANAAVYGQHLCEAIGHRQAEIGAPSSATLYDAAMDLSDTLVVVISQSGETRELVETAAWATRRGGHVVAVTNQPDSALGREARLVLPVAAGIERAVPATKTYTGQLVSLAVMTSALWPRELVEVAAHLDAVPDAAREMLRTTAPDAAARVVAGAAGLIVAGRGPTLSTAAEVALKVQETCRLAAVPFSGADLQHGPIALLDTSMPLLVTAAPDGPTLAGLQAVVATARERESPVVLIGGDDELRDGADVVLAGAALPAALAPIATVIAGQLLVEATALRRGLDPDSPTGLTKVTQTS